MYLQRFTQKLAHLSLLFLVGRRVVTSLAGQKKKKKKHTYVLGSLRKNMNGFWRKLLTTGAYQHLREPACSAWRDD